MTDIMLPNQCDCENITTINIDKNNPTGIMIVSGEYPSWGFKGDIEFEYSVSGNVFVIKSRRYRFSGANAAKNQRFEIRSVPILAIEPMKTGEWFNWPSSMDTPYYPPGMLFTFVFDFHMEPGGVGRSDTKRILLK